MFSGRIDRRSVRLQGDHARAARLYAESLQLRRDNGPYADVFTDLPWVIELAHAMDRLESAARLLGTKNAYPTRFGYDGFAGIVPGRAGDQPCRAAP